MTGVCWLEGGVARVELPGDDVVAEEVLACAGPGGLELGAGVGVLG